MQKIAIFTTYWDSYIEMFEKYNFPSLMSPGNIPKLLRDGYDVKWHVYSKVLGNNLKGYPGLVVHHYTESFDIFKGLEDFIRNNMDCICLMSCPDFFIGDKTLYNAVKIIENKPKMCLSVAHPRISLQKLNGMEIKAKTNAELVDFAFKYGHKCLVETEDSREPNLTWTGLSWRRIDENNYAVIHNLATPFLFQFTPEDIPIFCEENKGTFDRGFLGHLQKLGRIKLCGSSDLCFFVEITNDKHDPHFSSNLVYNDKPCHEEEGNGYWNDVVVNWRCENGRT